MLARNTTKYWVHDLPRCLLVGVVLASSFIYGLLYSIDYYYRILL